MYFSTLNESGVKFNPSKENEFIKEYLSTSDTQKKDKMFSSVYEHCKNMFFRELIRNYTTSTSVEDYETNFKIEFLKSIKNYDPDKGAKFTTYLFTKIKLAIQRTNKEESVFSIKEYKLNVLHIYKAKLITEMQKLQLSDNDIAYDDSDGVEMSNLKGINLRKVYDDMYKEYKLPKIKYESLIEELPSLFTRQITNTGDDGNDITDMQQNKSLTDFDSIAMGHIDIYFKIKNLYKQNSGNTSNLYKELVQSGFNLRFSKEDLENFYYSVSKGGEYLVYFLENNIEHPDVKIAEIERNLLHPSDIISRQI